MLAELLIGLATFAFTAFLVYLAFGLVLYAFMIGVHWYILGAAAIVFVVWNLFKVFYKLFTGKTVKAKLID